MTPLSVTYVNLLYSAIVLLIIFYINSNSIDFFLKFILNRQNLSNRSKKILLILYILTFIIATYYITSLFYAGIYNDFKIFMTISYLFYITIFSVLKYLRGIRFFDIHKYRKVLVFLTIIFLLFVATGYINNQLFLEEDEERHWETINLEYIDNNTTNNVSIQVNTIVDGKRGLFYKTPLILSIYEGNIKYNNINFKSNLTIKIKISLSHHPYFSENNIGIKNLTILNTTFDSSKGKYIVEPLSEPWIISYSYSGEKFINANYFIDGESKFSISKKLVTIEKSYVKSQVQMARAVIIFAIWSLFAAFIIPINKTIDWYESRNVDENLENNIENNTGYV